MGSNGKAIEIVYLENLEYDFIKINDKIKSANHILSETNMMLMGGNSNGMNRQELLNMYKMYYGVENLFYYLSNTLDENVWTMEEYISKLKERIELLKK